MSRRARLFAVAMCAVLLGGCANIPEQSQPQAIRHVAPQHRPGVDIQPAKDASPFDVVRDFVQNSGNPEAAKVYLTEDARQRYNVDDSPTIIEDIFSTVPPATGESKPDSQVTEVALRGRNIGRLGPDKAFIPTIGDYEQVIRLRRQADGQWRISEPPTGPVVTATVFDNSYQPVKLYFFDPGLTVHVPDQRYLPREPQTGLPALVIDRLLAGPSDALKGAVRSALDPRTTARTGVVHAPDGALEVDLTNFGDPPAEMRVRIAEQIVLSLQDVTASRVRLQVDDFPMIPNHPDWRAADVQASDASITPSAQLPGMVVVNQRVRSLKDGSPIPGPAGTGDYQVESAAQSIDGSQLAVVERTANGARLRVGGVADGLRDVELKATAYTRPTWRLGGSTANSNEVWTAADGNVVRVVRTREGTWAPTPVDAGELAHYGPITDLRLSRDGVRVAVVAGGKLIVGSVVRAADSDSVTVRMAKQLQPSELTNVVGVDWLNHSTNPVATSLSSKPVVNVAVDGLRIERYNSSNLTAPLTAITAAPGRRTVVTDANGMWSASDVGEVWRPHVPNLGAGSKPFYPG